MPKRKREPRLCHAPGCAIEVKRGILMCRDHWFALPRPLRQAINESWREGRIREWSANCLEARRYHAQERAPTPPKLTPEQSYALNERLLGER